MWRKIPTVIAVALFLIAFSLGGVGLMSDDWRWLLSGIGVFVVSYLHLVLLQLMRLTSDWPPGIIMAAGAEAERRRRRRRARRGKHDLVSIDGVNQ